MKNRLSSIFLLVILWIPQSWAVTIHSTTEDLDWRTPC